METTIFMITFVMWTTSTRIEFVTFLIATMRIIIFQFQWGVDTSSIYFFSNLSPISQPSGREHVKGSSELKTISFLKSMSERDGSD